MTGLVVAAIALAVLVRSLGRPVDVVQLTGWLALMGLGIGLVVAPMVGVVLSRLPGQRSGMAAAAVTAAREVGGVVGVSALGAVLYARLFSGLTQRLIDIGIPVGYRQIVIDAVRKGTKIPIVPTPGGSPGGPGHSMPVLSRLVAQARQALVNKTVDAGKAAYVSAVRSALVVAVIILVAGAVGVALLLRHPDPDTLPETV